MARFLKIAQSFYNGKGYPLLAACLIVCGHFFAMELLFGTLLILSMTLGCFVANDLRFAILPFTGAIFIVSIDHSPNVPYYSDYFIRSKTVITLASLFCILVLGLWVFAFRNRHNTHRLTLSPTLAGLLIFCIAITFNGAFGENYVIYNWFYCISFYLSLIGIYVLFSLYLPRTKESLDYTMGCFLLCGMIICAELLLAWGTSVRFEAGRVVKESVLLGWGVWTAIGGMLTFLLPPCFYFAATRKHGWLCYLLGIFQFLCIILSQSRGSLLIGALVLSSCVGLSCFAGEYQKRNRILTLLCTLGALCLLLVKNDSFLFMLENFIKDGFSDNGRFSLWRIGVEKFCRYPLFGSGFYDSFINEEWKKDVYPYLYHNTAIQILGACGILGAVGYTVHRILFFRLLLRRRSLYKIFLGLGILGLLLFSLLDVLFFNTYPTILYSLMLLSMENREWIDGN
ncbi:MAG: O-antigen ligase family protein [Clostridia bacterium]|nr:O-antigen ligase family protein [Clostridia bacterium]